MCMCGYSTQDDKGDRECDAARSPRYKYVYKWYVPGSPSASDDSNPSSAVCTHLLPRDSTVPSILYLAQNKLGVTAFHC